MYNKHSQHLNCFNYETSMNKTLIILLITIFGIIYPNTSFGQTDSTAFSTDSIKFYPAHLNIKPELPDADMMYSLPYSKKQTVRPNYKRLWLHTGVLFTAGVTTLGILELLPEDATAWNKEELRNTPFFKRWWNHVSNGPVWDHDNWIFNYVLHPYAGAAYYMGARSLGFSQMQSFAYCFCISTFFWEYGIEAFMEKPSIQDLIITPVCGMLIGETFYKIKRSIVANDYQIVGSRFLGNMVSFIVDPVNEVIGIFAGNPCRDNLKKRTFITCTPFTSIHHSSPAFGYTIGIQL